MTALGLPSPISWPPSQFWESFGGWSSFNVRVGSPAQVARVLVSTAGQATWVVSNLGCPPDVSASCRDVRGWLFNSSSSRTWTELGNYSLGLELNLYPSDNATFGLDTVALGSTDDNGGPSLDGQVVAAISGYEYVLGTFGLGQQPTNLTNFTNPHPSFLTNLYNRDLIPSLSWSYTAGAPYRLKGVFGSLTLGGYDAARFIPSNISFSLATDISRDLVVGLQSIISSESNGSTQSLLPSPHLTFIDSTIPYIYLPIDACMSFERIFGLIWNESYAMYLVSDELHRDLLMRNPTFKFELGQLQTGGPTVEIRLPYASLDLKYRADFDAAPIRYFPIQRADNDSQLTLGRTFLQEAYITTDYEHANFSVSQCKFEEPVRKEIVPILPAKLDTISSFPPNPSSTAGPHQNSSFPLSRQVIIGVVVGSLLGSATLLVICTKLYLSWRRRNRLQSSSKTALLSSAEEIQRAFETSSERSFTSFDKPNSATVRELFTLPGELPGHPEIFELPHSGSELPKPPSTPGQALNPPSNPRRRYEVHRPTFDISSPSNAGRRSKRRDGILVSPSELSTVARLENSYLDLERPLPALPNSNSPQRLSHRAWGRVAERQHDRVVVDLYSTDLYQNRFQHPRGFF
ncbi:MAG: hypothetical protein Q9209_006214 [Squamulea sp. 1 TL-2023]